MPVRFCSCGPSGFMPSYPSLFPSTLLSPKPPSLQTSQCLCFPHLLSGHGGVVIWLVSASPTPRSPNTRYFPHFFSPFSVTALVSLMTHRNVKNSPLILTSQVFSQPPVTFLCTWSRHCRQMDFSTKKNLSLLLKRLNGVSWSPEWHWLVQRPMDAGFLM